jgi:uncharacterized protein (TIGR02646 family)
MHSFDRSACPAPTCLAGYRHGTHSWDDVSSDDKKEIRARLEVMQGRRCAYCEGDLDALDQHIEHFRRKCHYPALTFDWSNLFWSCDRLDSCGHFKDHGAGPYNVADLINPCIDDPDTFFIFRSDGTISIRRDLSGADQWRARETLRVFSLDAEGGRLRGMRKRAVSGYVISANEAFEAGFLPEEIQEYFARELEYTEGQPFCTAIRHVLTERQ